MSTKPLTTTDYTYFAKVSEINISRDSGHISLGLFTEQGALIKRLSQNEEIEIGKNQLSTLCFGLVTNDGSGDDIQVLSGDKCTFKLVYGYKKGTASFVELGNSDNLTLTISNSRINIESGQETQITKAGQKDVSYKFNLAKN
ncbi:MAG: hypothetical protein MJ233_04120 [Mycoplasmoidaceae bacterium]|nr:hypothetical protein [Mycoplasmoidaceae bacterium]